MPDPGRRAGMVLSGFVLAAGAAGLWYARSLEFTEPEGAFVFPFSDDYVWARQAQFNPLGALVTMATAVVALVGVVLRKRAIILAAALASLSAAAFTVVDLSRTEPVLGGRGGNVALLLALSLGLAALELTPPLPPASADGLA